LWHVFLNKAELDTVRPLWAVGRGAFTHTVPENLPDIDPGFGHADRKGFEPRPQEFDEIGIQ
jgi:hypothetical protein